jgi:hypothetical protein
MTKPICVIGVTGNQRGSVAQQFFQDKTYRARGITRDPIQGIDIVAGGLGNVQNLISAFASASLTCSVTNYWEPFFRPDCHKKALDSGVCNRVRMLWTLQ